MELTIKSIIKILPFDEAFKHELLTTFDNLTPDERYRIEQVLWDLYDEIYALKLQEKIEIALLPNNPTAAPLDAEFYKTIKKEIDEELLNESVTLVDTIDLEAARDKLQEMMKEEENTQN